MVYVALENIRSLFNVGAIFRTCSFYGFYNVILVGYSGKKDDTLGNVILHDEISKTALGSENDLELIFLDTSDDLLKFSKEQKHALVAIEQNSKSSPLNTWNPKEDIILVFGNEVDGVSDKLLGAANKIIEISRNGKHDSLNVTTTCGIILQHLDNFQNS